VASRAPYSAYPNDHNDFYYFELTSTRPVVIRLTNYKADGDLLLYRPTATGGRKKIGQWGHGGSEMEIRKDLQPGIYYVRVYTADIPLPSKQRLYTLVVDY
jgi:hypothetical protein